MYACIVSRVCLFVSMLRGHVHVRVRRLAKCFGAWLCCDVTCTASADTLKYVNVSVRYTLRDVVGADVVSVLAQSARYNLRLSQPNELLRNTGGDVGGHWGSRVSPAVCCCLCAVISIHTFAHAHTLSHCVLGYIHELIKIQIQGREKLRAGEHAFRRSARLVQAWSVPNVWLYSQSQLANATQLDICHQMWHPANGEGHSLSPVKGHCEQTWWNYRVIINKMIFISVIYNIRKLYIIYIIYDSFIYFFILFCGYFVIVSFCLHIWHACITSLFTNSKVY